MAEPEKTEQKKAKRKNCANCSKQVKRIGWFYRNGKFFCSKGCFKVFDKKQKEEQKEKEEQAKQKQQEENAAKEAAAKATALATDNPTTENPAKEEPKTPN